MQKIWKAGLLTVFIMLFLMGCGNSGTGDTLEGAGLTPDIEQKLIVEAIWGFCKENFSSSIHDTQRCLKSKFSPEKADLCVSLERPEANLRCLELELSHEKIKACKEALEEQLINPVDHLVTCLEQDNTAEEIIICDQIRGFWDKVSGPSTFINCLDETSKNRGKAE